MVAMAINGPESVCAQSGEIGGVVGPMNPWPRYMQDYVRLLPWRGLKPAVLPDRNGNRRPHSTCAEAHLWSELMGRAKTPKNYTLVSFNASGVIAAPCANCKQWVETAFGAVYSKTTTYEGNAQQRP